jgi:multidrug efflux pump subunit AcrA (membrane-fusion protein)
VAVPAPAVVYDDAQPLVFVAAEGRYEPRSVTLGPARDGWIEIASGLSAGTPIVVTGASSLLSARRLPAGDAE